MVYGTNSFVAGVDVFYASFPIVSGSDDQRIRSAMVGDGFTSENLLISGGPKMPVLLHGHPPSDDDDIETTK